MQSHHQSQLPLNPRTDLQTVLEFPCHVVTDDTGKAQIKIEKPGRTKTIDYPYNPLALVRAFQEDIGIQEVYATQLTAMVLTCLSAYRTIAKELKELANPDKLEVVESMSQQRKSAKSFIDRITAIETKLSEELTINLKTLHEKGGSDYLEDITSIGEERRIELKPSFLARLKLEVDAVEVPEKRHEALKHFALRVEAVITHLLDLGFDNALVVSDLLDCTKKIVEKTQDPIAGAVYLQSNFHHFGLLRPNDQHNHTELLLTAQKRGHLNNDYLTSVLTASAEELPFLSRLPLTHEVLEDHRCFDYVRSTREALSKVCGQQSVGLKNVWNVFAKLEKQADRKLFLEHIGQNPASFAIYQLNHPSPSKAAQDFITKQLPLKVFYLDISPKKIEIGSDPKGNASIIDLVAIVAKRLSPQFIKTHNSPEASFPMLLEQLKDSPNFLKLFNLLCNQTKKMEIIFDDLFACARSKDEPRFLAFLTILEKIDDPKELSQMGTILKSLDVLPKDTEALLERLRKA